MCQSFFKGKLEAVLRIFFFWLPSRLYLYILFGLRTGECLDLKNPRSFSQKMQWLKLFYHNSEYVHLVDKLAVKDYVAIRIGKQYVIPTLGVWDNVDEIDWNALPNRFVIKTTHGGGGGGVIVCNDKENFDIESAKKKLTLSLKSNLYWTTREWPYKNVPRKIIAECNIAPNEKKDIIDYKFFCFGGMPLYCQVITSRNSNMCIDFFDRDWNHQPFHEPAKYHFAEKPPQKPERYTDMLVLAERLAEKKPFSRIDFYYVENRIFFGEITFFPTSGWGGFSPKEWDDVFGDLIELPSRC